jgi:hypothetical protein
MEVRTALKNLLRLSKIKSLIEPAHTPDRQMQPFAEETPIQNTDESLISVYPNPASSVLNIEYRLENENPIATVSLYDAVGKLIRSFGISGNSGVAVENISDLENGIYLISISSENIKTEQKKITVIR